MPICCYVPAVSWAWLLIFNLISFRLGKFLFLFLVLYNESHVFIHCKQESRNVLNYQYNKKLRCYIGGKCLWEDLSFGLGTHLSGDMITVFGGGWFFLKFHHLTSWGPKQDWKKKTCCCYLFVLNFFPYFPTLTPILSDTEKWFNLSVNKGFGNIKMQASQRVHVKQMFKPKNHIYETLWINGLFISRSKL